MTALRNKSVFTALILLLAVGYAWALPTDQDYERGRGALDRQDYRDAYRAFQDSIDSDGDQADAATYWLAQKLLVAPRHLSRPCRHEHPVCLNI